MAAKRPRETAVCFACKERVDLNVVGESAFCLLSPRKVSFGEPYERQETWRLREKASKQ